MAALTRELDVDLHDDLLTFSEAAAAFDLTEGQLRQWKRRGHLQPAGLDERRRPLFRGIDVLRAEAKTREAARRTSV